MGTVLCDMGFYGGSGYYDEFVNSEDEELFLDKIQIRNCPNPFNPSTKIKFILPYDSFAKLSVYDIKGRKVLTLIDKYLVKGDHSVFMG